MTKESILVTGGDGNISSEVIRQLSSKRDDLRIVGGVRSITKRKDMDKRLDHYDLIEIDYDNMETVVEALKGMDKLMVDSIFGYILAMFWHGRPNIWDGRLIGLPNTLKLSYKYCVA